MKTSVIEVQGMFSVWSAAEIEKRIGEVPGVESATVNYAAGNATVRYDETRLEVADIKSAVRLRGHEPSAADGDSAGDGHDGHVAPTADAAPKSATAPAAAAPASEDNQQDKPNEETTSK